MNIHKYFYLTVFNISTLNRYPVKSEIKKLFQTLLILLFFHPVISMGDKCSIHVTFLFDLSQTQEPRRCEMVSFIKDYTKKLNKKHHITTDLFVFAGDYLKVMMEDIENNNTLWLERMVRTEDTSLYNLLDMALDNYIVNQKNVILILSDAIFFDAIKDVDYKKRLFEYRTKSKNQKIVIQIAGFHCN